MGCTVGAAGGNEPVLEAEQVQGLLEAAGVDGVAEIMNAFWRSTDTLLESLRMFLAAGDWAGAAKAAHALKGSAANVGAAALSVIAREIEMQCKGGGEGAHAALSQAGAAYAETKSAFGAHLERLRRTA